MKIYVEGGGDTHFLRTGCRRGFSEFLRKAGLEDTLPQIVSCGGRYKAYDRFSTAVKNNENAMLLVDSEEPIDAIFQQGKPDEWKSWEHLKNRKGDEWGKPHTAVGKDCHLMVQCMEAWFLADRETLQIFFGQGFNAAALPAVQNQVELIDKTRVYQSLENATKNCKVKAKYGKGEHSFKLLALINPEKVIAASPWAKRFIGELKARMGIVAH
jgi:hypothetical protein